MNRPLRTDDESPIEPFVGRETGPLIFGMVQMVSKRIILSIAFFCVSLFLVVGGAVLVGCRAASPTPDVPPDLALDQMPAALLAPLLEADYELVGYYPRSTTDRPTEVMAVLTVRGAPENAFSTATYVLLMRQTERDAGGDWRIVQELPLEGLNARSDLRDLTGDTTPELVVVTEEADRQFGDFVTPLRYTDRLTVIAPDPAGELTVLGSFQNDLAGVRSPMPQIVPWDDGWAIQIAQDVPLTHPALRQTYRLRMYAWDGQTFACAQVMERKRLSAVVAWIGRQNAPWAAGFLVVGGALGLALYVLIRRRPRLRWLLVLAGLLVVLAGIGVEVTTKLLCPPALVLTGLVGMGIGWRLAGLGTSRGHTA